jgi:hypothetical protein
VLRLCAACLHRSCLHYAAGAGHARCINILLNEFVCVSQPAPASQQQPDQPQQQRLVLLPEATLKDSIRGMTRWVLAVSRCLKNQQGCHRKGIAGQPAHTSHTCGPSGSKSLTCLPLVFLSVLLLLVCLCVRCVRCAVFCLRSFVDLRTRTGFSALHYATFWGFLGEWVEP